MKRFSELRIRLTVIYTLVTASLTIAVAFILYFALSLSLESNTADTLELSAKQLASAYEILLTKSSEGVTGNIGQSFTELSMSLSESQIDYVIWNADFEIAEESDFRLIDNTILRRYIDRYFTDRPGRAQTQDYQTDTTDVKICTYVYVLNSGELNVVQTVKDMRVERSVLRTPLRTVVFTIFIGLVLSGSAGYFLAGRALKPIRKSYEMQRDFLADASHELRTPVSVIQTNLEVLKDNPDEPVENEMSWIDNAYFETKRMKEVIENLLTLAKADAGETMGPFEPVDLTYLIMGITETLQSVAARKDIKLIADINEVELFVAGAEKSLRELITILVDNAIKYTNPGGQVIVRAYRSADQIRLEVEDNGIGIPQDAIDKIFLRFYRVDKARSRQEGGTGLGLSIAKWIAEEHRATIRVRSIEGEGTTMIVTFPAFEPGDENLHR